MQPLILANSGPPRPGGRVHRHRRHANDRRRHHARRTAGAGNLKAAGLLVIPITGRPIGWCEPFMAGLRRDLAGDAMVAENGAVAFTRGAGAQPPLVKRYQQDAATRSATRRMREIAALAAEVPGGPEPRQRRARDRPPLTTLSSTGTPETVQQVLALLQREGMQTTVSSIHIHGCFGDFNKMAGRQLDRARVAGAAIWQEEPPLRLWATGNDQCDVPALHPQRGRGQHRAVCAAAHTCHGM